MDTNNPTNNLVATAQPHAAAAPTPAHHFNLSTFLQVLLAIAPALAAPFIPADRASEILAREIPAIQGIGQAIAASQE